MQGNRFITLMVSYLIMVLSLHAQRPEDGALVSGKIISTDGGVVEYASVQLDGTAYGSITDAQGLYHIQAPAGSYLLKVSVIGYKTESQKITLQKGQRLKLNITIQPTTEKLGEVTVTGNAVTRVNQSAYNAVAVDMKKLRNSTQSLGSVLDRVSGVKIREEGGVGSAAQINLNGFTGKHVKVFMDGIPMEGAGASFQINNIPADQAERIEVYKGVVPVELGGDALGGAINIVTGHSRNTYVDASYSYGSFNTHRSNVTFGHTARNGFTIQLNAYQNYSDNDYKVKTSDSNRGDTEEKWYRRFHDRYHNEAAIVKLGVTGKSWADRLLLGMTYSRENAQIQNSNIMSIVYGGKVRKVEGWAPTLEYVKRDLFLKHLDVNLSARYDHTRTNNIDTVSRMYYWTGEYRNRETQGEGGATLAEFKGRTAYVTANARYSLDGKHVFSLNNLYSNYVRRTNDYSANATQNTAAYYMPRHNNKNILGLSYKFAPSDNWNVLAFGKYYHSYVKGPVNVRQNGADNYQQQSYTTDASGYGVAGTYIPLRDVQAKVSFEKTLRLPNDRELFGDGDLEKGDANLRPESSRNINFNLSYMHTFADAHTFSADAGFNYRYITDYIIRSIKNGGIGISENHGKVRNMGGDLTVRYYYKDRFTVGGNFSYQDMRDRERLTSYGSESVTYGDRVPNLPYMFGNADASYTFHNLVGDGSRLVLGYAFQYVHDFYWDWKSNGAKRNIPMQVSHDANATLSLKDGRYNVALEVRNLTNSLLYDNYSLQKPGRSFSVKFRYFFVKTHSMNHNK